MAIVKRSIQAAGLAIGVGIGTAVGVLALWRSVRKRTMRGKVVVITGGSRGLGLELAHQFGRAGAHLALAARDEEELIRARGRLVQSHAARNGACVEIVVADVSLPEDANYVVATALKRFGRVDILINNAGVMHVAPFVDQTASAFEEAMRINFFSALYMTQAVVGHMRQRGEGAIVNIASLGGKIGVPHMLPYVASKFALVGFSEGLHAELASDGIQVTTVCPGLMRTGAHVQAKFGGDSQEEYRWFLAGAPLPGISIAASRAAAQIFRAVLAGHAEITITPQAWLAARIVGLAPAASQNFAAAINRFVLPKPVGNSSLARGSALRQPESLLAQSWNEHLQRANNQVED